MKIMIPMCGLGERFAEEGYSQPKPLIKVLGNPMLFYVISSLGMTDDDELNIVYRKDLDVFNIQSVVKNKYPNHNIVFTVVDRPTKGAIHTIEYGLRRYSSSSDPIMILDCDTFYGEDILSRCKSNPGNRIFYFDDKSSEPIYSYIEIVDGLVTDIKEKTKISNNANTGCYVFDDVNSLKKYCQQFLDKETNTELYTSMIYNEMLKNEETIYADLVKDFVCIGTPLLLKTFASNAPHDEKKRFCFDLDNTLVTYPKVHGDYSTVEPIQNNIRFLKYLKDSGHYIIIYTARRMKTHGGNVSKVVTDIGGVTMNTLKVFEIPYDEICFGKPYADFYIDDLAVDPYNDPQKSVGFYDLMIAPRNHNNIEMSEQAITKTSNVLNGELHWYKNIPPSIDYVFPSLLGHAKNSITIEKINGILFSHLFCSGALEEKHLVGLLNTLSMIHRIPCPDDINLSEIYSNKLRARYMSYDYSKFPKTKDVFEVICKKLEKYESQVSNISVMHGDPVFSNVFLSITRDINLIDMRGHVGDVLTIGGDEFYDYAKVLQSIRGYDYILNGVPIDYKCIEEVRGWFDKWFLGRYTEEQLECVETITDSLLFSLIPLHDNEKCKQYYSLIRRGI